MKSSKTKTIKNVLSMTFALSLISCMGQSSDPLTNYSQLKKADPTDQVSETQYIAPDVFTKANELTSSEIIDLKLQGPNDVNNANFIENQEGLYYFKVLPKSQKITQFKIEITDLLMGTKPITQKPVIIPTANPYVFALRWKAPIGILPPGQLHTSLTVKLQSTVVASSDENLKGLIKVDSLEIYLNRDNSVPQIIGKSGFPEKMDEGAVKTFTIDIEDPSSVINKKIPEVLVTPYIYSNTEAYRADGSVYASLDYNHKINPERSKDDPKKWTFYYQIAINNLPLDRDRRGIENPLSPEVDVCFHIRAISSISTQSEQQQLCLKALYAAQPPAIDWDQSIPSEISAGKESQLKFKIYSANNLGEISISNPNSQIARLTGTKDLACSFENENHSYQICTLTWKPTCVKQPLTKKLTLKISNKTGQKTKTQSFTKEFKITPDESACAPATSTKSPATKEATK
ncbi:MAG: hypothetical protein KDD45_00890 [Bdellovibrionales bacterium]|nr:hypothetical protein [Bdellovibrionales bacterium]